MKRFKLFLAMAALACAIGLTVKYGSTYRPVVEPVREIEEIWALEDAREESEEPLVTRLFCNGIPMAYDADSGGLQLSDIRLHRHGVQLRGGCFHRAAAGECHGRSDNRARGCARAD